MYGKPYFKQNAETAEGTNSAGGANKTTSLPETQTEVANTANANTANANTANANTANANTESSITGDPQGSWVGDKRYYQSGTKAGMLKRGARVEGDPDAIPATPEPGIGLRVDDLKNSTPDADKKSPLKEAAALSAKNQAKKDKRENDAKIAAKMIMRMLDTINEFVSGGTYGENFDDNKIKKHLTLRDQLENDWQTYLATLDIPMHPALVVAFGSLNYVAPAFATPKGQEKVATIKEKFVTKAVGLFFRSKK